MSDDRDDEDSQGFLPFGGPKSAPPKKKRVRRRAPPPPLVVGGGPHRVHVPLQSLNLPSTLPPDDVLRELATIRGEAGFSDQAIQAVACRAPIVCAPNGKSASFNVKANAATCIRVRLWAGDRNVVVAVIVLAPFEEAAWDAEFAHEEFAATLKRPSLSAKVSLAEHLLAPENAEILKRLVPDHEDPKALARYLGLDCRTVADRRK